MAQAPVVIVGGGISGLSAAYFLSKAGIPSTVIEKTNRLGGLIGTDRLNDCLLEAGPDAYLAAKPAATELAAELGLKDDLIGSNDSQRRIYIARQGRLVPLPRGMVMMVPGELRPALKSELFSFKTKLLFVRELFSFAKTRTEDVSISEFIGSHFGDELVDCVAEPLLAGVYGGAAEKLSAMSVLPRFLDYERKYGSLIRGVRRERQNHNPANSIFLSFRHGMQQFPDALVNAIRPLSQIIHAEVEAIEWRQGRWHVHASGDVLEAEELVLACPAHASGRLLCKVAPKLASELRLIPYSSALLITFVYRDSDIRHPLDGFGFLVPRAEGRTIAAATWIHRKFPSRVPHSVAALRAFIVDPEASRLLAMPQDLLFLLVRAEFERFLGIDAEPIFSSLHVLPESMPQYAVGHEKRIQGIRALAEATPKLSLLGNFFDGVGIPDCVRLAKETANRIEKRFNTAA